MKDESNTTRYPVGLGAWLIPYRWDTWEAMEAAGTRAALVANALGVIRTHLVAEVRRLPDGVGLSCTIPAVLRCWSTQEALITVLGDLLPTVPGLDGTAAVWDESTTGYLLHGLNGCGLNGCPAPNRVTVQWVHTLTQQTGPRGRVLRDDGDPAVGAEWEREMRALLFHTDYPGSVSSSVE